MGSILRGSSADTTVISDMLWGSSWELISRGYPKVGWGTLPGKPS